MTKQWPLRSDESFLQYNKDCCLEMQVETGKQKNSTITAKLLLMSVYSRLHGGCGCYKVKYCWFRLF